MQPSDELGTPRAEALTVDRDTDETASVHPLRQLWLEAAEDRKNSPDHFVEDRGTWNGDWPLPSRSQWQAISKVGGMWPRGQQEAMADQTEAAKSGWQVWVDNDAVRSWPLMKLNASDSICAPLVRAIAFWHHAMSTPTSTMAGEPARTICL